MDIFAPGHFSSLSFCSFLLSSCFLLFFQDFFSLFIFPHFFCFLLFSRVFFSLFIFPHFFVFLRHATKAMESPRDPMCPEATRSPPRKRGFYMGIALEHRLGQGAPCWQREQAGGSEGPNGHGELGGGSSAACPRLRRGSRLGRATPCFPPVAVKRPRQEPSSTIAAAAR